MLKKNDLVIHETGIVATVLKTYIEDKSGQEYVQAFTSEGKIMYEKKEQFELMDSMRLKCNNCNKESYEDELDVKEENQMYVCDCGCSTFTVLNQDFNELGEY